MNGCKWLKEGVQRLIDNHEILFEKIPTIKSLTNKAEDLSIITISNKPFRIPSKDPIRISNGPTIAEPIPYFSNKAIPWNYGAEVYYHGIKQDSWINENARDSNALMVGCHLIIFSRAPSY